MNLLVSDNLQISEEDKNMIVKEAEKEASSRGETIDSIHIWADNSGYLCYQPHYRRNIQRVRRITGYFSEINNFNDAKKAELRDRVNHI